MTTSNFHSLASMPEPQLRVCDLIHLSGYVVYSELLTDMVPVQTMAV